MMHCPHSTRRRARVRSFCIFRSTSQLQIQLSGILNGRQAHLLHRTEMIIPKLDAMWTVDLWGVYDRRAPHRAESDYHGG